MTITRRLVALVMVPLVFTGVFAAWALATTGAEVRDAARLMRLVAIGGDAAVMADRLQRERAAASAVLLGGAPFERLTEYVAAIAATDDAVSAYRRARGEVVAAPTDTHALLDRIDDQLDRLPALRRDVREGPTVALSAVLFTYRITIADVVSLRESVAQADGGSAELVGRIRAAGALSRATEQAARLQVEVMRRVAAGAATTPADQQSVLAAQAGYREAMSSFGELAPASWQDWLVQTMTGPDVLTAQQLEDLVARSSVTVTPGSPQWMDALAARLALLHQVERQVDEAVRSEVDDVYGDRLGWVVLQAVVVLVALLAAVVMAVAQSRTMIRRLRGLADAARSTAFVSLPQTVEHLRGMGAQTIDPEAFANQVAAPVTEAGTDEIADVGSAFASVHRQAILTAADLANMRAGQSQILLHLARRNQRLVGVLIRELDGAERGEDDPDRLATLFRLDQLATRMGRYTDNLLVVGGQTATRADSPDVGLDTVLRGAQSKIEQYQRVQFSAEPGTVLVRGGAVHDLMNLLAELLDNATQFSPPESRVLVAVRIDARSVGIAVRDFGVGLPPARIAQANEAMLFPPPIDVSAIRSMGLTVVAHLAARHGIGVQLRPGPQLGLVVDVTLPASLCAPAGQLQPAGLYPPVPAVPARAPLGAGHFSWFHNGPPATGPATALRGVADAGFSAAARVGSAPTADPDTEAGLPRRRPMANLLPGTVADGVRGVGAADVRDPAGVAASVAAFAHGNAQSRARAVHAARPVDAVPSVHSGRHALSVPSIEHREHR